MTAEQEEQLLKDVADIKEWAIGNPLKEIPGVAHTLKELDKRVSKVEKRGVVGFAKMIFGKVFFFL